MKKITLLLSAVLIVFIGLSQKIAPDTYLIKFKDKNNSVYSIDKPQEFLSEKAIIRRQKFNIPITIQDIPVNETYIKEINELGLEIYAISKWLNLVVVHTEDSSLIEKAGIFDFVNSEETKNKHKKKHLEPKFELPQRKPTDPEFFIGVVEVKSEEDLKFLEELGLDCCQGVGSCPCKISFNQLHRIKAHKIHFKIDQDATLYEMRKSHHLKVNPTPPQRKLKKGEAPEKEWIKN